MLPLLIAVGLFVFFIAALFVSRSFSPIPYFPSNKKDIKNIVKALNLRNGQVVYDLGAGDGAVIFASARHAFQKNLNTTFIAVEINPVLNSVMWMRKFFHPNKKNIRIVQGDIFSMRYTPAKHRHTFFTYISPWYLQDVYKNVRKQVTKFDWISYYYPTPGLKASRTIKEVHAIYTHHV